MVKLLKPSWIKLVQNLFFQSSVKCLPPELMTIMINLLGRNSDAVQRFLDNNCSDNSNTTASPAWSWELSPTHKEDLNMLYGAENFYAYFTPIIIVVGLIGNALSMKVFHSRRMRKVSASFYLTALAVSDSLVLVTYVLLDWLARGLPMWPGSRSYNLLIVPGMCQVTLLLSYVFRFMSAWLIVIFTVERFIGVCKPLHRRALCTHQFAKRAIIGIMITAFVLSSYKPALSGIIQKGNSTFCAHKPDYVMVSFVLDAIYACIITVLPFSIIAVLNCLILKKLNDTKQRHKRSKMAVDESCIKLEFTAILLTISSTFVVLNMPYFILWCMNFHQQLNNSLTLANPTQAERMRGWMYIAKTIFFGNYCVNFFMYSLTGAYFRRQLIGLLCRNMACVATNYPSIVSNTSQKQSHRRTTHTSPASPLETEVLHKTKDHKLKTQSHHVQIRTEPWVKNYDWTCV